MARSGQYTYQYANTPPEYRAFGGAEFADCGGAGLADWRPAGSDGGQYIPTKYDNIPMLSYMGVYGVLWSGWGVGDLRAMARSDGGGKGDSSE